MSRRVLDGLLLGTALAVVWSGGAVAEPVTLKTIDGSFSVVGDITDFDGQNYTINTAVGSVTVAATLVVCEGADCPQIEAERTELMIAGDRTLGLRLVPALVREFSESLNANTQTTRADDEMLTLEVSGGSVVGETEVSIQPTNSSAGLEALFRGEADLALSTRPARSREVRAFEEFGLGALRSDEQETIIALDGLVLVTHPNNAVRAISEQNAGLVFAGQLDNWAQLGGRDAPINLYVRDQEAGSNEVFDALLMRPSGLSLSADVNVLESDEAIAEAVANDPNGIGFTSFASSGGAQTLAIRGECGLQIAPTAFSIKTEEYPLTRLLYMYQTNKALSPQAQAFASYMVSEDAQDLVATSGFIDQSVSSESINAQGLRVASAVLVNESDNELPQLREMMDLLIAAERLSTTYRFETGSARLNSRAEADVERLAELLATDRFTNREVIFVGFTDSVGDAELNRQLSQQRAEQVLQSVLAENPQLAQNTRMSAIGYGEISPLGCNESNTGRLINRRVEVWVKDIVAENRG